MVAQRSSKSEQSKIIQPDSSETEQVTLDVSWKAQ